MNTVLVVSLTATSLAVVAGHDSIPGVRQHAWMTGDHRLPAEAVELRVSSTVINDARMLPRCRRCEQISLNPQAVAGIGDLLGVERLVAG